MGHYSLWKDVEVIVAYFFFILVPYVIKYAEVEQRQPSCK
jgi:hypothetical protein